MTAAPDLRSLSPAEREILALLAQGHTAKSIAAVIGRSEAAVNERLRDARRKTGVGSSRELARLVRAQECRDEQFGVAQRPLSSPAVGGAPMVVRRQGVLMMIVILAGLVAVASMMAPSGRQASRDPADPLFADASANWGLSPASVRATMAHEPRDAAWADGAEKALRADYAAVPGVDAGSLRIACRSTWCEVLGRSASGEPTATLKAATTRLGLPSMRDGLAAQGLHADISGTYGTGEGAGYRFTLLAYWHRTTS